MTMLPTYHDLHITTALIERTSIFNLPYDVQVTCTRVGGWEVWHMIEDGKQALLAGEYSTPDNWLILDVAGHVIVDSR